MLIGISAKPRRGKDMLADWLSDNRGFYVLHWADALYAECYSAHTIMLLGGDNDNSVVIDGIRHGSRTLLRMVTNWFDTDIIKQPQCGIFADLSFVTPASLSGNTKILVRINHRMGEKDGLLLQWWGTNYRRRYFGEDYWIDKMSKQVDKIVSDDPDAKIVIPDTRFTNEAEWISERNGKLIRIEAEKPFEPTGRDDGHVAETQLDNYTGWDAIIFNRYNDSFIPTGVSFVDEFIVNHEDELIVNHEEAWENSITTSTKYPL